MAALRGASGVRQGARSLELAFSGSICRMARNDDPLGDGAQVLDPLTVPSGQRRVHAMLNADAIVLELELPADKREFLQLELAVTTATRSVHAARAKSGSCNIDVACPG